MASTYITVAPGVFDTGKKSKPFGAYVIHKGLQIYIGYFATIPEAKDAILVAKDRLAVPVTEQELKRPPVDRIDRIRRSKKPGHKLPYALAFEIGAETHPDLMDRFLNEAYERGFAASKLGCRIADLPEDWFEIIQNWDLV